MTAAHRRLVVGHSPGRSLSFFLAYFDRLSVLTSPEVVLSSYNSHIIMVKTMLMASAMFTTAESVQAFKLECSLSLVPRYLLVSPMYFSWLSAHLIS